MPTQLKHPRVSLVEILALDCLQDLVIDLSRGDVLAELLPTDSDVDRHVCESVHIVAFKRPLQSYAHFIVERRAVLFSRTLKALMQRTHDPQVHLHRLFFRHLIGPSWW